MDLRLELATFPRPQNKQGVVQADEAYSLNGTLDGGFKLLAKGREL